MSRQLIYGPEDLPFPCRVAEPMTEFLARASATKEFPWLELEKWSRDDDDLSPHTQNRVQTNLDAQLLICTGRHSSHIFP